ncbi:hypothetical protein ACFW4K_26190 [Nocardiopsis alba]|uniref:hypothetical protein n=1 Tax=Nocardiopsis alba TaxID=53437 RepID=UPI00366ACD37
MSEFDIRLVAYEPNGPRLGPLPHPLGIELGQPYNDLPSLRIDYTAHAPGAEFLESPCEIAVQMYDPATGEWHEGPDSRFLRIKRSGNLTDRTAKRSYDLPGYGWQLRKLRLYPAAGGSATDGKRTFAAATVGTIVRTWTNEGAGRGALPGLEVDFDTARDSAGRPWGTLLTLEYDLGTDLLTVLNGLAEQGVCDWRFEGRTLRLFGPETVMATDRASGEAPVDLRLGRDITDAPEDGSLEDVVSHLLLEGDEGFRLELANPDAETPWGRWEEYLTQGGVADEGTARLLAGAALERGARERVQVTRGLVFLGARWLPWRDYAPGDLVLAPGGDGTMEPLRLRQITLSRDQEGTLGGNVVLNDRFLEAEIRRARRTAALTGGSVANGGSGSVPAPEGNDRRRPAAPQGLVAQTNVYLDSDGAARGQVSLQWAPVDSASNGTAMDVGFYQVYSRPNTVGAVWSRVVSIDHPDTTVHLSGLEVGADLAFKVRAVGEHNNLAGAFGGVVSLTVALDAEPPPVPPAPELSTRLGVINVGWDGRGAGGEVMPPDFLHTEVEMRDGHTWSEEWEVDGPPTDPWETTRGEMWVRDGTLGSVSDAYAMVVRDLGVLDQEYTVEVIAPEEGPEGAVYLWTRVNMSMVRGYSHEYVPEVGSGTHIVRVRVQGWRRWVWVDGVLVREGNLTPEGPLVATGIGVAIMGGDVRIGRVYGPEGGDWRPVGPLESGPAELVVPGQPYHEPRYFRLVTVDRSGNRSEPGEEARIATTPLVDTDLYPETVKAGHIAANSITADKIDVGAVEAGHIAAGAVTADTVAAGAIDGQIITGSTVRSAASGRRWVADRNGIRLLATDGTTVVDMSSASGSAYFNGRVQAGTGNENHVVMDRELHNGRPGVRFHTGSSAFELQPTLQALGVASQGYSPGAFVITGRERTTNQTGRTDLVLRSANEGGALRYVHGSYTGIGVTFEQWSLMLRGRLSGGIGARDMFGYWRSHQSEYLSTRWTLTYAQVAHNGGRLMMVGGHGTNNWGRHVLATVISQGRDTAYVATRVWGDTAFPHRVQYLTVWVDADVSGA